MMASPCKTGRIPLAFWFRRTNPMKLLNRQTALAALGLFVLVGLSQIWLESYADARAGGGRSGGFRGSRSYSSPARPTQPTNPAQPRRDQMAPAQQSMAPQAGGFMRTFGMAMLGGLVGSMLFSGLAGGRLRRTRWPWRQRLWHDRDAAVGGAGVLHLPKV